MIFLFFGLLSILFSYFLIYKKEITINKFPTHIGVIMDGNGRWATFKGLKRYVGHIYGSKTVITIIKEIIKYPSIKYATIFSLSTANLNRPEEEINFIYKLMESFIDENIDFIINSNIKISTIGNCKVIPISLQNKINNLKEKTNELTGLNVILAINYDSRTEITNTVKKIINNKIEPENLSWDLISKNLETSDIPDPDLIVRTSGEYRLSNFLMLQSANAELIFINKLWPDFNKSDLEYCLNEFSQRQRRFGLTPEQTKTKNS